MATPAGRAGELMESTREGMGTVRDRMTGNPWAATLLAVAAGWYAYRALYRTNGDYDGYSPRRYEEAEEMAQTRAVPS